MYQNKDGGNWERSDRVSGIAQFIKFVKFLRFVRLKINEEYVDVNKHLQNKIK